MQRNPIKEPDILDCLTAGVVAPADVEQSSGSIRSYYRVYGLAGATIDIVPAFGIRVVDLEVFADGLPILADNVFVSKENDILSTSSNLCIARVGLVPVANEIARCSAITTNTTIEPWVGDYIRVDMSNWTAAPATVRVYFEAV